MHNASRFLSSRVGVLDFYWRGIASALCHRFEKVPKVFLLGSQNETRKMELDEKVRPDSRRDVCIFEKRAAFFWDAIPCVLQVWRSPSRSMLFSTNDSLIGSECCFYRLTSGGTRFRTTALVGHACTREKPCILSRCQTPCLNCSNKH